MRGEVKINSSIVVQLDGCGNVEVSERDLLGALVEDVNCLSHDGVVGDFLLVAVAKNQHRGIDGLGIARGCRICVAIGFRRDGGRRSIVDILQYTALRRKIDDDVQRLFGWRARVYVRAATAAGVVSVRSVVCGKVIRSYIRAGGVSIAITVAVAVAAA